MSYFLYLFSIKSIDLYRSKAIMQSIMIESINKSNLKICDPQMIRQPRPHRAARNSPIMTPTRDRPIFTFILLIMMGMDEGTITFSNSSFLLPPRVRINLSFSLSTCKKPVQRLIMEPNTATDIPATIIVLLPVPSQTIISGARADLGREFSITRQGSVILLNE